MKFLSATLVLSTCIIWINSAAAQAPSIETTMMFRPTQKDVDYEIPAKADYAKCKVEVERINGASGWIVYGPQGQILRRFVDTNADAQVDQWRYFSRGYEVYRDIDSNNNNKVDQSRWLNIAGSRWGIDSNEDGKIDRWKQISAEEATREAILALSQNDVARLERVLIDSEDMREIQVTAETSRKLLQSVSDPATKLKQVLTKSRSINSSTKWMRFDSSMLMPYLIPADDGKAKKDLVVYENVMAIVETAGNTGFVQIGEVIQVGSTWKLTQVPQPVEGETLQITEGGILMQPPSLSGNQSMVAQSGLSPEVQKLLTDLQALDGKAPTPQSSASELAQYNSRRVQILQALLAKSSTEQERVQWLNQMIDGLFAAVQTGKYADGLKQLVAIEADLKKQRPNSPIIAYVVYRRMMADYTIQLQQVAQDTEKRGQLQTAFNQKLQEFVKAYPDSPDAADALLQLAVNDEFTGNVENAKKWYQQLVKDHPGQDAATRAKGALKRLDLKGKSIALSGPGLDGKPINLASYRGKTVLVIFWSSWCQPCTEDLPQILELYQRYRSQGFEIVGVNLDVQKEAVAPYIAQYKNNWPHIYESGGLDGRPALEYGIISLPTMFLVDRAGIVINPAASVEDLKEQLPEVMKK